MFAYVLLFCGLSMVQEKVLAGVDIFSDLQEEFRVLKEKVGSLENELTNSKAEIEQLKNKGKTAVIFSAAVHQPGEVGPFGSDTTLIYNSALINMGAAYNTATGVFTAPVNGVYYFTLFFHASGRRPAKLHLMLNGLDILETSDHQSLDGADNGGNAVIMALNQNDIVYVRLAANTHVWGTVRFTSFSGFLLREL